MSKKYDCVEELRQALMDEYGAAMMLYPAAVLDLARVEAMTDVEVLEQARKRGWIS